MQIKSISFLIFIIGILYMVIDGWIVSWWLVPDYRELGHSFVSGESFFSSDSFFIFWALSVPLGSIITAVGLAIYVRLDKGRFIIFFIGSVILLAWLAIWSQSLLYPVLYGIGGGLILFAFIISIWSLAKLRKDAKGKKKSILDLRAVSYILFLITAWGLCGLLGVPTFGLRPEMLLSENNQVMLFTMSAKVLVCFVLGWMILALSQYLEMRNEKRETKDE